MLGTLVLGQWAALLALALSVRHNGWLYYQGGDETYYYTTSWILANGHIADAQVGYGWSLLLAPIALVAGASFLDALPAVVVLQAVVLLPVALVSVYAIAASIGGRLVGYVAAAAWAVTPFAFIPLWADRYHEKFVEQFLPQALGLTGLADFPSLVCLLAAAALCARALDRPRTAEWVLAGLFAGFAIAIKPANALFLAGPILALSVARRVQPAVQFGLGLAPCVLALALWKYRGLGYLPLAGASSSLLLADLPLGLSIGRYLDVDWSRLKENYVELRAVLWSLPLLQTLPLLGVAVAVRRAPAKVLMLAGWAGAFLLVKGSSEQASIDDGSFLRLFMPGFPPLVILAALIAVLVPRLPGAAPQPSPIGRRPVVAAFAVFALVPLLLFAVFPTAGRDEALWYFREHVLLPVERFDVEVTRRGVVSWRAQPSRGVRSFYRILRARPSVRGSPPERNGVRCLEASTEDYAGAADCRLEMSRVGETRSTRFVDTPPPGRWVYRVGLAANWRDDLRAGDVLVVSEPQRLP